MLGIAASAAGAAGGVAGGAAGGAAGGVAADSPAARAVPALPSCGTGSVKIARTGAWASSASMASRGPTATSTYPGAICAPTENGRAGVPSTEINAAPFPETLAITPSKANLSAGPGPGPAATGAGAPSKRASATGLLLSDSAMAGAIATAGRLPAESPACAQYQPAIATPAQIATVATRHTIAFCKLIIRLRSSHSASSNRKLEADPAPWRSARKRLRQRLARGFTLIELMVVLVIIGVLAALIVPNVLDRADDARVMAARTDVNNLIQALRLYKLDNHRLPTAEQGLQALVAKPTSGPIPPNWRLYLDKLPNDPWGRPYQYLNPGVKSETDVMSLGADGQAGGEGKNADIGSWD